MLETLLKEFVFMWTVVDPIGTVPVFIAATAGRSAATQRRIALRAVIVAAAVLVFFILAGRVLLHAMSIEISAFQIAGGIIMFLFALQMIFGTSKPEQALPLAEETAETSLDVAVFPLAVPAIAGPGAMIAAVLLTDNHRHVAEHQARTMAVMLVVLAIQFLLLLMAGRIQRAIGDAGASVVSRVMGTIIAALAASMVLAGVKGYFKIA